MRRISTINDYKGEFEDGLPKANCFSRSIFWYTIWIFRIGLKRDFDEDDLTDPLHEHRSSELGTQLSINWCKQLEWARRHKMRPSLCWAVTRTFGLEILWYGLALGFMELGIRIYQPIFVGLMLRYYSVANEDNKNTEGPTFLGRVIHYWEEDQSRISHGEALVFGLGVLLCSFVAVLVVHPIFCFLNYCGMKIRIAICSLIYRKVLRLDTTQLTGKMIGNVINILSNDVNKFESIHFIHYLWLGPATVAASIYFIYKEVGDAAYFGMIPVMCCIPLQAILGTLTRFVRIETAVRTDNRVQVMNEIIQGIRVIKMYAWEYAFSKSIDRTRKHEMHSLIKASVIKGIIMSLILFITRSGHFITTYYFLQHHPHITIDTIFFVVSYYQILRMTMTVYFPQGVGHVSEIYVSLIRITDFLMLQETDIANPEPLDPHWLEKVDFNKNYNTYYVKRFMGDTSKFEVDIQNAYLRYGKTEVLSNISMFVGPGVLTAMVGPVGSGKSCILHMILEELKPYTGRVRVKGSVSYATQDPFLFAGTVRQNILFGDLYDRRKYNMVVRVCALSRDFTLLPYGDRTLVGEKGISLSGGQRARINLARCVYRDADIYLLDDPLSAVDANVGKQLFDECIRGFLRNKVVILTTHQLQYLKFCEQIVYMEDGHIRAMGSYTEIYKSLEGMVSLLPSEEMEDLLNVAPKPSTARQSTFESADGAKSVSSFTKRPNYKEYQEIRSSGTVGCDNLRYYYLAGGNWCFIMIMFIMFALSQCAASIFDYMMTLWSRVEDKKKFGKTAEGAELPHFIASWSREECSLYAGVAVFCTFFISVTRSFYFYGFCMRASISLHNRMFQCVTRAHLRFFTLNSSGRILNRFSKDMGAVDEMLPYAMVDTFQILLNFVGMIGLLPGINVWLTIITAFIVMVFYVIRKYYLAASCSLKRLEGIARSPVFTHVNATMQGLAVIRSHNNEMLLANEFDKYQDIHTSASYMFMAASRAFGYLLDLITVFYTAIIIYFLLYVDVGGSANAALILTQCIGLTGIFQWGMRQSAEFETQLTAVERVLEFTRLESEPPLESAPGMAPPSTWPEKGTVELKNIFMRYALTEQPVLRNVSLRVESKEKIGIVGRTGAGKSSMIGCLFRLAYIEGQVIIDGIETSLIGLHDLRKKISIIPQEPVIFSGTLRYNLDPFSEYSDVLLYSALVDVDLHSADNPNCLNDVMSDGGINLSVGSRQLVCLARAIVRKNKILILDEATANVDIQTDYFIQKTIREKFEECTVLTIAHRLNTIMDSDKVMVLDSGQITEFDHPYILLQNPESMFSDLVRKTGEKNVDKFKVIAKEAYDLRFPPD